MPESYDQVDEQDQSETFDETHIDDEGDGDILLDEADEVLDVTQTDEDSDEPGIDESDEDREAASDRIEAEADSLLGLNGTGKSDTDSTDADDGAESGSPDDIELVFTGLMRNQRGAQASAAHWEARRLDDDDIEALGYGPDAAEPPNLQDKHNDRRP